MQRKVRLVILSVVVLAVSGLAMYGYQVHVAKNQPTLKLLQQRAAEYNAHLVAKDYGAIWDMGGRNFKAVNGRDEFIKNLGNFFNGATIKADPLEVKRINSKLGVSLFQLTLKGVGKETVSDCMGIVWVWADGNGNWNFFDEFVCKHEKEVVDNMMRYSDIKNAPK